MTLAELRTLKNKYPGLKAEKLDLEDEKTEIENKTITDTVKGSSTEYPYLSVPVGIEGHKLTSADRHKLALIDGKITAIIDTLTLIDKLIDNIEDSTVRYAVRHYIKKGESWKEIHQQLGNYSSNRSEAALRMKVQRTIKYF